MFSRSSLFRGRLRLVVVDTFEVLRRSLDEGRPAGYKFFS